MLVRPDFQVYGASADAADADELVRTLEKQLRMPASAVDGRGAG